MREFKGMGNSHTVVLKLPTMKKGQQHGFCLCGPERHSLPCLGRMIMDFTSSRHFIHSIHHQAPPNQVTAESFCLTSMLQVWLTKAILIKGEKRNNSKINDIYIKFLTISLSLWILCFSSIAGRSTSPPYTMWQSGDLGFIIFLNQ